MSAVYPLDLEREIDRRWFHRVMLVDRPLPLDRPKHPNDIRPLPKRHSIGVTCPGNQNSPKAIATN
jgi:hypothetical protein